MSFQTHMETYVQGQNGATFTPAVSDDSVISWQNDKGLDNPDPVSIKGDKGDQGIQGEKGDPSTVDGIGADEDGNIVLGALQYHEQTLSDAQQMQAQTNLGIPSMALWQELHNALQSNYEGVDLTEKFADEIAQYDDQWAWIKDRIQAGNFERIYIGDYLSFVANENTFHAQVAGINTYKAMGDVGIGNHIDFVCKEAWSERIPINLAFYNNGISAEQPYPWLCCNAYAYINSLQMDVPSSETFVTDTSSPELTAVDYSEGGIWYHLPPALQNVIVEKRRVIAKRYSTSGKLNSNNGSAWMNIGKLWFPNEIEVFGSPMYAIDTHGLYGSHQYPLFAKPVLVNSFFLGTPSINTSYWDGIDHTGISKGLLAPSSPQNAIICFRIA